MKTAILVAAILAASAAAMLPTASAVCVDVQGQACFVGTTNSCRNGQGVGLIAVGEEKACVRIDNEAALAPWGPLCGPDHVACADLDCEAGGAFGLEVDGGELLCVRF